MEIVFDFSPFFQAANQGTLALAWYIFKSGGWIVYLIVIVYGSYYYWLMKRQHKWFATHKFVILAIDIPKDTEQTPKAVEQLFATISGAHKPMSAKEIYLKGMFQLSFSFEIVSIDGYVQFLIRTPEDWRDLVESAIYSQYPDAEITEVEDYVNEVPNKYPNETHKIWGTEVILAENDVLPIRTYPDFEDAVSGEFKDPMASLLETMSRIQVGEQVWLQIIVKPTGFSWPKRSMKEAMKLAGKKTPSSQGLFGRMWSSISGLFFLSTGETWLYPTGGAPDAAKSKDKDDLPSMMLHLTPGEREKIEAIERKAGKGGFECKIRLIYISPIEQYSANRVVSSVFGSIKQFNTLDLNSFKPDPRTKTQIMYLFIKSRLARRRTRIMEAYKSRSGTRGHGYFILNTEELATIWHFPSKFVKTPLLQKTETKKSQPPAGLPYMPKGASDDKSVSEELRKQLGGPIAEEFDVDLADKHFEEKFEKKDNKEAKPTSHKAKPPSNLPTA